MKLSAKAEYACLAAIALARHGTDGHPVRIRDIAEAHAIPERYLVQILLQLKGAGIVYSTRGSAGGYRLARPPEAISLGEILLAIDGPGEPPRERGEPTARALASFLEHVRATERDLLERTTLAQIVRQDEEPHDWVI